MTPRCLRWSGWVVACAASAGVALAADSPRVDLTPEAAIEGCAGVGQGYIRLADTGVCLRLAGEITASASRTFGGKVLELESGYIGGHIPAAAYGAVPRSSLDKELRGKIEAEAGLIAIAPTALGPLTTELRVRGVIDGDERHPVEIERAYVQLYPVTLGRRESFFDHLPGYNLRGGYVSDTVTNLVALSRDLTDALHLRLSIEDGNARRMEDGEWARYGAHDFPDLVIAARYLSDARTVHVAAAAHRLTDLRSGIDIQERRKGWGWAATASVEQAVQYGATAGRFLLTGSYADGAIGYLGIPFFATDFIVSEGAGIGRTAGYSLMASYLHIWSPHLTSAVTASLYRTRTDAFPFTWRSEGALVQLNTEIAPVAGLVLGAELSYARDRLRGVWDGIAEPWQEADDFTTTGYVKSRF